MIANTPPTVLLAEGWSLIIPSAVDRGDKPSRPGQAGQDRSSSRALHLDRLGLAHSLTGGVDGRRDDQQDRRARERTRRANKITVPLTCHSPQSRAVQSGYRRAHKSAGQTP
jgi:hypothetical protein